MSKKQHYHLYSAKVLYRMSEDQPVTEYPLNTTIVGDHPYITARQIGRAQQGVQMLLFKKMGQPVEIIDVFTVAISRLGFMSEAEFTAGVAELQAEANADAGHA